MSEINFQRLKEIFAQAMEQPAAQREAFMAEVCGADAALRAEVEALLQASGEGENLIEKHALNFAQAFPANGANLKEKYFGPYKIIREIGRGGMGAVFLAERSDGQFQQQVALKIVRQTIADSELEKRFRRERQILASLNHPHITQLHDGGVGDNGEPFLVMEFIAGEPLRAFAENHNLNLEERLHLFLKICAAVSYAHRHLVIHRDLKPSNILVTDDGTPKLLDFGLAKMLDDHLPDDAQTATAFRAFTPSYAAPEQIRGANVTTASDIYSLGVVLYELLTNQRPFNFESKSFAEILQEISDIEPIKPSQTENPKSESQNLKSLAGDLDTIVLMALRKEPERRYQTVEAFAGDIEKYLQGLPVSARRATFSYRAAKLFQRNKIAASASALIVLALAAGLSLALWQANVARKQRDRAEKRFQDVRQLANSLLFEITPKIENLNGSTAAREVLVKRSLEYLDSLANEAQNDAQLQIELASAYEKIGELQASPNKPSLNDLTGAIESYRKAQGIRANLPETLENQRGLAENYRRYSDVIFAQNDFKGSLKATSDALGIYGRLSVANQQRVDLQISYLETRLDYGATYSSNNQYGEAIPVFQEALTGLALLNQNDRETQRLTALARAQLSNALSWDGKQPQAEAEMAQAIKITDDLVAHYPNDNVIRRFSFRIYSLASGIYETIKDDVSLKFAQKAWQVANSAVESDAADLLAKVNLAKAFSRLGICLVNVGQISPAIANLQQAGKLFQELSAQESGKSSYQRSLAVLHLRVGDARALLKDYKEALKSYQHSADLLADLAAQDDKNTLARRDEAQSLKNVGETQLKLGQKPQAKQTFQKALEILASLQTQNALGEVDLKMMAEVQTILQKM